jgi:hypothetical protein
MTLSYSKAGAALRATAAKWTATFETAQDTRIEEGEGAHIMTTADTLTDAQIERLRVEAAEAGDLLQVALCDRAMGLTPYRVPDEEICRQAMKVSKADARIECARVIADAEAMQD